MLSEKVSTLFEVIGMVLVSVAAGLVYFPAGLGVFGACLVAVGILGVR